jgi:hypothetical protein
LGNGCLVDLERICELVVGTALFRSASPKLTDIVSCHLRLSMTFTACLSALLNLVVLVLLLRTSKEMIRVDAKSYVAVVTDMHPIRYRTLVQHETESVSTDHAPVLELQLSVTV